MWNKLLTFLHRHRVLTVFSLVLALLVPLLWPDRPVPDGGERLRSELELRGGLLYLAGNEVPFTGTLVENYSANRRKLEVPVVEGKAHGVSRGWYDNGQLEVEESFVAGVSHGTRTRWHRNGTRKSTAVIVDGMIEGTFRTWHENGQKAAEAPMDSGKPHGLSLAWYPSGTLKSRVRVDHGKPANKEFFPDSQPVATTTTP